jgi:hypothetical protein
MKRTSGLRRRSRTAPQMRIKQQLGWPARLAVAGIAIGCLVAVGVVCYDLGRHVAERRLPVGASRPVGAAEQIAAVVVEHDRYSDTTNSSESQLTMERSAQKQLGEQVKLLDVENNKLKEDLAFFESLLPADKNSGGLSIRRIKADMAGPNQLRYRLLVMQGGKGDRDFSGNVQVVVTLVREGKTSTLIFPDANNHDATESKKFALAFKRYQRIEGLLTIPDGAEVKSLQAKILEKGQIRAQQNAIIERNS